MTTFDEVVEHILKTTQIIAKQEKIALRNAANRILAEDVLAKISMPLFRNSAMDGYAIDSQKITPRKVYPIQQICSAGEQSSLLNPLGVARIYTGAIVPEGADCVIPQEDVKLNDKGVIFSNDFMVNKHIRQIGEDFKQGDLLLQKGNKIGAMQMALLISAGIENINVYQPLKVAVLATGDEIVENSQAMQPGKIFDSNRPTISTIIKNWGMDIVNTNIIADNLQKTQKQLLEVAENCDVIVTTGGVSVGDRDFIKEAMSQIGQIDIWKVRMKPGKPLVLGKIKQQRQNKIFIGLPGNPVSAVVVLLLLGRILLFRLQGANKENSLSKPILVKSNFSFANGLRQDFLRARWVEQGGQLINQINLYENQQSHIISSLNWADGLVSIPAEQAISPGDSVAFYPFNNLLN